MAHKIVWAPPALRGLNKMVGYLEENFTEREVSNFIKEIDGFLKVLADHHDILRRSAKDKNLHRGPLNALTIIIYRVKPTKKEIEIVNLRSARQKPLKWR